MYASCGGGVGVGGGVGGNTRCPEKKRHTRQEWRQSEMFRLPQSTTTTTTHLRQCCVGRTHVLEAKVVQELKHQIHNFRMRNGACGCGCCDCCLAGKGEVGQFQPTSTSTSTPSTSSNTPSTSTTTSTKTYRTRTKPQGRCPCDRAGIRPSPVGGLAVDGPRWRRVGPCAPVAGSR